MEQPVAAVLHDRQRQVLRLAPELPAGADFPDVWHLLAAAEVGKVAGQCQRRHHTDVEQQGPAIAGAVEGLPDCLIVGRLVLLARSQQGQPEAAIHGATGRTETAGFGSAAAEDRSGEVRRGLLACRQVVDAAQSLHHLGIAGRFADGQFLLDVYL